MEAILWIALGITACLWVGIIAVLVAFAWRLHRRTSEKLQAERKGAGSAADHRYDPKQFRRQR